VSTHIFHDVSLVQLQRGALQHVTLRVVERNSEKVGKLDKPTLLSIAVKGIPVPAFNSLTAVINFSRASPEL
jgi:hypothetical protein